MRRSVAVIAAAIAAFFVFYTVRLLVVTHLLTAVRAGGKGAYVGAIAISPIERLRPVWRG